MIVIGYIRKFINGIKEKREREKQLAYINFLLSQMVGEEYIRKDLMEEAERRNVEYEGYVTCENGKEILILRLVISSEESWFAVHLFADKNCVIEEDFCKGLNAEEAYNVAVRFCRCNS